jgi:hypothetical protein
MSADARIRNALRATNETVPGTRKGSPTGTDIAIIRMTKDNVYPLRPTPILWSLRGAEGGNLRVQTGSSQIMTTAKFSTPLYYAQAKIFLAAACSPATGPPQQLPTLTLDHMILLDSGSTYRYQGALGFTVAKMTLKASNQGQGVVFDADFEGVFMTPDNTVDATVFPIPAVADFPATPPFVFQMLSGGASLNGARTGFKSFDLTVTNHLAVIYDESATPLAIEYKGRDVDFSIDMRYKAVADRADYDAVTARAASAILTDAAGNTIEFQFESTNFFTAVTDELPMAGAYYQNLHVANYLDQTAATDMTLTITDAS